MTEINKDKDRPRKMRTNQPATVLTGDRTNCELDTERLNLYYK